MANLPRAALLRWLSAQSLGVLSVLSLGPLGVCGWTLPLPATVTRPTGQASGLGLPPIQAPSAATLRSVASSSSLFLSSSAPVPSSVHQGRDGQDDQDDQQEQRREKNASYIATLMGNLESALRSYQFNSSMPARRRAYNLLKQIEREDVDGADGKGAREARNMAVGFGMPLEEPPTAPPPPRGGSGASSGIDAGADSEAAMRKDEVDARRRWESARPGGLSPGMTTSDDPLSTNRMADRVKRNLDGDAKSETSTSTVDSNAKNEKKKNKNKYGPGNIVQTGGATKKGRSIMSTRSSGGPDAAFLSAIEPKLSGSNAGASNEGQNRSRSTDPDRIDAFASEISDFKSEISGQPESLDDLDTNKEALARKDDLGSGEAQASALVARAGAGGAFQGKELGIGGLDDVLAQIKRRVWVPLAAPPSLLQELGISAVRGLLLYGLPGCGKTLLARGLGSILSPARPVTVVSGPEIMDRFVGSSEANLREIFDSPPDVYDAFRVKMPDMGEELSRAALHVIVLDEFDAIARARGGGGDGGSQGDAGVARDSVVNQLLAKLDGVDPLPVPTLVIGLTNKRSLIDSALLRPGRFEVQVEVPKPRTNKQRKSILKVHMSNMFQAGRVLVSDPPQQTAAARMMESKADSDEEILSYDQLLAWLSVECDGMTGASLAAVARAAASRALERSVYDFAGHVTDMDEIPGGGSIIDCLVTQADLKAAIEDVFESAGESDGGESKAEAKG